MKSLYIRLLTIIFLIQPLVALAQEEKPRTLMVFGDSLSAAYGIEEDLGWVNLLDKRLQQENFHYRVVNASVSGETSTGGLARLPAMLSAHSPSIVILELGGNDGLRGLPLENLKANLEEMVGMIKLQGAQILLAGIQIPPNYGPRYTVPFFELFGEIADQEKLPLIPFLIDGIPQQPELMQNDGIHPKAEAQWMIVENVWPYLEPLL